MKYKYIERNSDNYKSGDVCIGKNHFFIVGKKYILCYDRTHFYNLPEHVSGEKAYAYDAKVYRKAPKRQNKA